LITFLLLSGIWERRIIPILVSLTVGILYGGALLSGVVPSWTSNVSWEGHLFGAIAGALVAYSLTRNRGAAGSSE